MPVFGNLGEAYDHVPNPSALLVCLCHVTNVYIWSHVERIEVKSVYQGRIEGSCHPCCLPLPVLWLKSSIMYINDCASYPRKLCNNTYIFLTNNKCWIIFIKKSASQIHTESLAKISDWNSFRVNQNYSDSFRYLHFSIFFHKEIK